MKSHVAMKTAKLAGCLLGAIGLVHPALAQAPALGRGQLDELVKRIALYPDPLLAHVLTASTFWEVIPEAAGWAGHHSYLHGDALAKAMDEDHLNWDPSVLALLPFPNVLDMMARDPGWTAALGNAVLIQRPEVMDAVQRMRRMAWDYHYLAPGPYIRVVAEPGAIEILPVDPGLLYVPVYDPAVVFVRPRVGIAVGGFVSFGPGIVIGAAFAPFGWRGPVLDWRAHAIIIDNHPWGRAWGTRATYVHPYATSWHHYERHWEEHHERH